MGIKELVKHAANALKPATELTEAQRMIKQYRAETENDGLKKPFVYGSKPGDFSGGCAILESDPQLQAEILREIVFLNKPDSYASPLTALKSQLLSRKLPLLVTDIEALLSQAAHSGAWRANGGAAVKKARQYFEETGTLTPSLTASLNAIRILATAYSSAENRKFAMQIDELLGQDAHVKPDAGEVWTDKVIADLETMTPEARFAWSELFARAVTAESSKPSAKWLAEAERHKAAIGETELAERLISWLTLTAPPPAFEGVAPRYDAATMLYKTPEYDAYHARHQEYNAELANYRSRVSEKNIVLMKGLTWYAALCPTAAVTRAVGHMTQTAFASVVGFGTWATKAGNAGIWALGQMPGGIGVGALATLRTRLRDRGALKLIAAAIESAAKASGMTVDELEDLAVPTGGLDADGTRTETFGEEGAARLTLDAATGRTKLEWFGVDGKPRKAVPAGVKREFAAEVKALKAAETEIASALSAQAARLDKTLLDERVWTLGVWRERYGSHPVLGNLARRMIWTVNGVATLHVGDGFVGVSGQAIERLTDEAEVKLWHPISAPPEEVMRWRDALETRGLTQPFKQAHREVYLLTDAERATGTYSNRFAAHILKQHQFNSLCILRGWKNTLRLMVDDVYPPATRLLPQFGLRAEFWVEGVGDDYGTDTNDAGTYLRVATDQVRFYRELAETNYAHAGGGGYGALARHTPAEPVPLAEVPPLALSEVMRDVDLFVGVASLGNDPAWSDGGPAGQFRAYWSDYAFGDLGETAKTRAEVLGKLLPRLKIASRCRLDGKFLVVRGDLRTYKIHLGSGNILMEPNDQYLCIVPGRSEEAGDLFLPFEGDRMLAIILSKAFLLADDTGIKDRTILSQIKR